MRAAIIGAGGFLGKALSKGLLAAGHHVSGYDVVGHSIADERYQFHTCDVLADTLLLPPDTDVVYYLAQSPFYRDFPDRAEHLFGVNSLAPLRVASAARATRTRLFVYASTGNVYMPSFAPLKEDDPVRRDDPYALSKLAGEEAVRLFDDFAVVCVRFFGLFGPGQTGMLPVRIRQMVERGEPVRVAPAPGELEAEPSGLRISMCFVEDTVDGLLKLSDRVLTGERTPQVLNMGGAMPISIRLLAETTARLLGREACVVPSPPRSYDLIADNRALYSLIDMRCTPFEEAMRRTMAGGPER